MTTLTRLLPELLLSISDFLPPADLYCFSVCNRRLYTLLSRQINRSPPLTPNDKFSILTRLERDTPKFFACQVCNLLHWYNGFDPSQLPCMQRFTSLEVRFCLRNQRASYPPYDDSRKEFSFLHLKLAMRRFYYGPESGISTSSLSHIQVNEHYSFSSRTEIHLASREAEICTNPLGLYLRLQDIFLFTEERYLTKKPFFLCFDPLVFCLHDPVFRRKKASFLNSLPTGSTSFGRVCHVCNTSSEIEFCEFDSRKALIITRWLNLGPGLDQQDPLWKNHTRTNDVAPRYSGFDPNYSVEAQDPRLRFEETVSRPFEDLRLRNLSYLRDDRYRRIMRCSNGIWCGPPREKFYNKAIKVGRSLLGSLGIFPSAGQTLT